jgi:hypothetical protein
MEGRHEDMSFESDIDEVFDIDDRQVSREERNFMSPASHDMYTQHDFRPDTSSKDGTNFQLPPEHEFLFTNSTTEQVMEICAPSPILQKPRGTVLAEEEELREDEGYDTPEPDDEGMHELLRDLIEAQERLQEQDQEIARKDEELRKLQRMASNLTATQEKEILGMQNQAVVLQQKVDRLTAELEVKDKDMRSKESEFSKRKSEWETTLQQLEQQKEEQLEKLRTEIVELRTRTGQSDSRREEAQEARGSSIEQNSEIVGVKELEAAQAYATESELERMTAQATEIVSLRSLLEFFKSNCENVASKSREVIEENMRLQEAVEARDLEIKEQKSLISILGGST